MIASVLLTYLLPRIDALSTPACVYSQKCQCVWSGVLLKNAYPEMVQSIIWVPEYSRDKFTTMVLRQKYL